MPGSHNRVFLVKNSLVMYVVRPCPGESLAQATAKQQSQHVEDT